jgi:hypothetical protein
LLALRGFLPLVKILDRHQATALPERLAERRLGVDLLGPGVLASLSVIMKRGVRICFFSSLRNSRLAACLSAS